MKITLEDGLLWVKNAEKIACTLGAHVGLTGSVLFNSSSEKDMDVIVYPHDSKQPIDKDKILKALNLSVPEDSSYHDYKDKDYGRCVAVCTDLISGHRIDIFFME